MLQLAFLRELIVILFEKAERAAVDSNLAVGRSLSIVTRHAEGFSEAQKRTTLNGRAASIGVVASHDERAFARLGEGTVV